MTEDPTTWHEIHGFRSPMEYQRFQSWLIELQHSHVIAEVPVSEPYAGSPMFVEAWYRAGDGRTWRLVAPDPPFRGVFELTDPS